MQASDIQLKVVFSAVELLELIKTITAQTFIRMVLESLLYSNSVVMMFNFTGRLRFVVFHPFDYFSNFPIRDIPPIAGCYCCIHHFGTEEEAKCLEKSKCTTLYNFSTPSCG